MAGGGRPGFHSNQAWRRAPGEAPVSGCHESNKCRSLLGIGMVSVRFVILGSESGGRRRRPSREREGKPEQRRRERGTVGALARARGETGSVPAEHALRFSPRLPSPGFPPGLRPGAPLLSRFLFTRRRPAHFLRAWLQRNRVCRCQRGEHGCGPRASARGNRNKGGVSGARLEPSREREGKPCCGRPRWDRSFSRACGPLHSRL